MKFIGNEIENWAIKYEEALKTPLFVVRPSEFFTELLFSQFKLDNNSKLHKALEKGNFGYLSIFYRRVKLCHSFTISDSALVLVGSQLRDPGDVVMACNYMQYLCFRRGIKHITPQLVCDTFFPDGFLSEQVARSLWEQQKVKRKLSTDSDNLLDYRSAMRSIEIR